MDELQIKAELMLANFPNESYDKIQALASELLEAYVALKAELAAKE